MNEKSARSVPCKGISVGLFSHVLKKSESIMNQENAPHMQPMEQAGNKGQRHTLPTMRGSLQPKRRYQTLSPRKRPFPLRVRARTISSLPRSRRSSTTLSRHTLWHALWWLSTTWLRRTGRQPAFRNANGKRQRPSTTRAIALCQYSQQPRAAGWSPEGPSYPVGYQQPQASYPPTSVSAVRPRSEPSLCSRRRCGPTPSGATTET